MVCGLLAIAGIWGLLGRDDPGLAWALTGATALGCGGVGLLLRAVRR